MWHKNIIIPISAECFRATPNEPFFKANERTSVETTSQLDFSEASMRSIRTEPQSSEPCTPPSCERSFARRIHAPLAQHHENGYAHHVHTRLDIFSPAGFRTLEEVASERSSFFSTTVARHSRARLQLLTGACHRCTARWPVACASIFAGNCGHYTGKNVMSAACAR